MVQPVGCGTISDAPGRLDISYRSAGALTAVRPPSSRIPCAEKSSELVLKAVSGCRVAREELSAAGSLTPSFSTDTQVIEDARRIGGEPEGSDYIPTDPKEFCNRIFHTCYMGTVNSSKDTRQRAKDLANAIGRYVCRLAGHRCSLSVY